MRQACRMLDQSPYVDQLVCAVGGVLVFIAESEWRGGEQKKLEKLEFDMPSVSRIDDPDALSSPQAFI